MRGIIGRLRCLFRGHAWASGTAVMTREGQDAFGITDTTFHVRICDSCRLVHRQDGKNEEWKRDDLLTDIFRNGNRLPDGPSEDETK